MAPPAPSSAKGLDGPAGIRTRVRGSGGLCDVQAILRARRTHREGPPRKRCPDADGGLPRAAGPADLIIFGLDISEVGLSIAELSKGD